MVFRLVTLSLWVVSCVTGQFLHPAIHPYAGSKSQYHFQDSFGFGKFGHTEPTSSHHSTHDAYGNKAGEFSYLKPDGTIHMTKYVADSNGYRVLSNDLPVGPSEIPTAHLRKRRAAYPYSGQSMMPQSEYLADTPEVAAAKMSHFQEHIKRGNYHIQSPSPSAHTPYPTWSSSVNYPQQNIVPSHSWFTPTEKQGTNYPAVSYGATPYTSSFYPYSGSVFSSSQAGHPTVTADGYLKDTPEVAQAKAAHFAEKAKVTAYNDYPYEVGTPAKQYETGLTGQYSSGQYSAGQYSAGQFSAGQYSAPVSTNYGVTQFGSPAHPTQVTDTPEVSAAKASHFAEHAAALTRNYGGSGSYVGELSTPQYYSNPAVYSGVPSVPAETPEVAQAKAAHFAEYNRVAARRLKRSISYGTYPASTLPLVEPTHNTVHPFILPHPVSLVHLHRSSSIHHPFTSSFQLLA